MKKVLEPIGPENDYYLKKLHAESDITIASWGIHGKHLNRGLKVCLLLQNLYCLTITKGGQPGHPLYLKQNLKPILFKGGVAWQRP